MRGGYDLAPQWGLEISASQFDDGPEAMVDDPAGPIRVRFQAFLLDFSFVWHAWRDQLLLFAGPGLVDVDYEFYFGSEEEPEVEFTTSHDLAWHAGVAYRWSPSPGFYLRLDVRGRYSDTELYDQRDLEASIAAGWRF